MVFRQKGGPATKRNFSQATQKVPKKEVFEVEEDDDDEDVEDDSDVDDSDRAEGDSAEESDSDASDSGPAGGKLNAKGKQTPTQGKGASLIKTPKGQSPALSSGKKNQLATSFQRQVKQNSMKEFPGIKGKAAQKEEEEEDDDDDDDSDEDDDDDDSDEEMDTKTPSPLNKSAGRKTANDKKDMHVSFELPKKGGQAQMKSQQNIPAQSKKNQQSGAPGSQQGNSAKQNLKGAQGKGAQKAKNRAEPDDDEDDDDDLDDDDELSDEENDKSLGNDEDDEEDDDDDDDDEDDDEDDESAIKKKVASLKKEMLPKKGKKSLSESPTKSQEPKSKKGKTLLSNQQEESNKPVHSKAFQESLEKEKERKRERDARNLFVRNLPTDVSIDEIKALSPDILDVSLPKGKFQKKGKKAIFGFLEFANEQKAEENYLKLQNKKFRGQEIFIDYSGEKSTNKMVASSTLNEKNINKKKLFVSGLPVDTNMHEVAELFPNSFTIILNNAPEYRNANALFHTEEEAAEAFKANENAKIRGRTLTVLYAMEKIGGTNKQQKRKRPFEGNRNFSPPKSLEGGNRNFSQKPFGGNKNFSPKPFGGNKNSSQKPFGGNKNFSQKPFGGNKNFSQKPFGGNKNFSSQNEGNKNFQPHKKMKTEM